MAGHASRTATIATILITVTGIARAGVNVWTPVGPNGAANLMAIAVDPVAPDTLYIGLKTDRRVWKTTDGGGHWLQVGAGIPPVASDVIGLAVSPADSNVLFAATSKRQVYKSTDGGATWNLSGGSSMAASTAVWNAGFSFQPGTPNTVYVSFSSTTGSLFKSTDGGDTWERHDPVANVGVMRLVGTDSTPPALYAALGVRGIYKSTDGALTWNLASNGLPFATLLEIDRYNVSNIAADPASPDTLYAASSRDGKLYKTTNGAADWSPVSTDANWFGPIFVQPGTGYVFAIGVDYLGSSPTNRTCVFRSTDGGAHFSDLIGGHQSTSNVVGFHPTDPDTIYAGLDEGLYKTTDGGTTWSPAYGAMRNLDALEIAFAPSLPSTYWVGYWVTMGKTTDSGATFTLMNPSASYPYGERFAIHPTDPNTVLTEGYNPCLNRPDGAACPDSSLVKTTDGGATWTKVPNPLFPDDWGLMQIWGLLYDPADASIVYALGPGERHGIYKSSDGGATFAEAGATTDPEYTFGPYAFVAAPTVPTTLYIGTASNWGGTAGVWRSTDQAATWQLKNAGLPAVLNPVRSLAVHPTNPAVLFATVATPTLTGQGIYKTIDGGDNWTLVSDFGLSAPMAVAVDPAAPDTLYASVTGDKWGIYRSTDGGANWQPFFNGLESLVVWRVVVDPANHNHLLAGTRAGVYEITIDAGAGDSDFDGIADAVEDGAPNGGDGNKDGIPDRTQPYVASLPSTAGPYATLVTEENHTLGGVTAAVNPSPGDAPTGAAFPYGFFRFSVYGVGASGGAATVTLTVPPNRAITSYYRYGPTPDNATAHWYQFAFDGQTGAEVFQDGDQTRIVLHFLDGARGDDDLQGNGTIVDAGGPAAVPIPASERAALIAFYNSTNGDLWANKTGWKTPPLDVDGFAMPNTECGWRGITCNSTANVVSLVLPNNRLTGTLSDLSALTHLQTLNVRNNVNLTAAPVPSWVAAVTTLATLDIYRTHRIGDIPDLSGLASLTVLDLSSNSFNAGPVPAWIAAKSSLVSLNLNATNRTGGIPDLSGLPALATLNLGGNPNLAAGPIPAWIAGKTSLTSINLSNTNRAGDIPDLSGLTGLTTLSLNTNLRMRGPVPTWLSGMTKLVTLQLSNTRRTGAIPDLSALVSLAVLDLSNNWTLDPAPIPAWLDGMPALTNLYFQYTNRTGTIPDLHHLAGLVWLNLGYNPTLDPAPIPSWLTSLTSLNVLFLNDTNRNGLIPDLSAITDLVAIDLTDNPNLDAAPIPAWLVEGPNLGEVYLGNTNRTGAIPDLHASPTLYWLDFANNPGLEAGPVPAPATFPPNLNGLYLYNTNRTSIATDLSSLPGLQYLDLGGNPIPPGPVPSWIIADTALLELSLANAGLTGAFPDLSALSGLDLLDLHGNPGLTAGEFPSWLSTMSNLNYIYLGDTNRTGDLDVPVLAALPYPVYLDLSNSPTLTAGPIPSWVATKGSLQMLSLTSTNRTGDIPDLSGLTSLLQLYLDQNPGLTAGGVPAWPASMPALLQLRLTNTNRTGTIPAWVGASNLRGLWLADNHLGGAIPPEVGDSVVRYLQLQGNMLTGTIPSELANLIQLWPPVYDPTGLDLRWNALHTADSGLTSFLNSRQVGGDWQGTQTIAPDGIGAAPGSSAVAISWSPITYTADAGGYRALYSKTSGGPYAAGGITADKSASALTVSGLDPGTPYYFVVETQTDPHANNANTVVSERSAEVATTTGWSLSVSRVGAGSGTVTSSPAGIACGAICAFDFAPATAVTLTAVPAAGSVFAGWSGGGCTGFGTCQVTMNGTVTVAAKFNPVGPNLDVVLAATPPTAVQGQEFAYTATVRNVGTASASAVTLIASPPIGGATVGTVSSTQGSCAGTAPVMCSLGTVATGATATVTIHVLPASAGTLAIRATVTALVDTDPTNNSALLQTACLVARQAPAGVNSWTSLNVEGGDVYRFGIDPFDHHVVYAATLNGAFKTSDRGAHWSQVFGPQTVAVAPHPTVPGVVFLADRYRQIHKSTDGGATWPVTGTGVSSLVSGLIKGAFAFWPPDADTVFYCRPDTLLKTTDGGASWTTLNTAAPLAGKSLTDLVVDPGGGSPVVFLATTYGVFKSTDGGATFVAASSGLPVNSVTGWCNLLSLAFVPGTTPTLLTVHVSGRVYASTDGGASWQPRSTELVNWLGALVPAPDGATVYATGFDSGGPSPSNRAAIWVSPDLGVTWNVFLTSYTLNSIAIDPTEPAYVYASMAEGMYVSGDAGATWSPAMVGLRAKEFDGIGFQPGAPATFYAHGNNSGIFKTTDAGATFANITGNLIAPINGVIAVDPNDVSTIYSAGEMQPEDSDPAYFDDIVRSTDGGASWNRIPNPDPANHWYLQPWGLVLLPTAPTTIFAGGPTEGVFKSTDGGATLAFSSSGLPAGVWLSDLVSTDAAGSALFVAAREGLFKSTDGAATWVASGTGLPLVPMNRIAVAPSHPATMFAATGAGVYKTIDSGDHWTAANTGLPLGPDGLTPAQIRAIVVDPADPAVVYASPIVDSMASVYTSRDGGASWWPLNGGAGLLPVNAFWRMVLDPADHTHLIAGGRGGLYETKLDLRRLTAATSGTGAGTVTSAPGGIACGSVCVGDFAVNQPLTLTAAPATGSTFTGWSGACAGTAPTCDVTMDAAKSVTATFTVITPTLTVTKSGTGSGTVTSAPAGIACGATCSASFDYNQFVTLSAAADTGSKFTGWSGEGCSGTGTCQVTMDQARSVTATFDLECSPVVLSNQTITTTQIYTSCSTLTAGPAFRVETPGNVTCRSAVRVVLTNGFSVGPGATFKAGIDPSLAP